MELFCSINQMKELREEDESSGRKEGRVTGRDGEGERGSKSGGGDMW